MNTPYGILAVSDTYHDFWPPRGTGATTTVSVAEEGEDDVADVNRLERVHGVVDNVVRGVTGQATAAFIQAQTGIPNVRNDIEWKLVEYFEDQGHVPSSRTTLTYEEILSRDTVNYINDVKTYGDCLEITSSTGRYLQSLSVSQRNQIANFIMTYMDIKVPDNTQRGMIFDAAGRDVNSVFEGIGQVKNYIFPQNIADSAATSFTALGGRYQVMFPTNERMFLANGQPVDTWLFRSNVFSAAAGVQCRFLNNAFSRKNPYGFALQIGGDVALSFSLTQKDGPSVNYLSDLMTWNGGALPRPSKTTILSLDKLAQEYTNNLPLLQSILLDLKRGGDHEQVNASLGYPECYFVTVDILCSLYARLRRKPCILHTPRAFRLYRFPTVELSPMESAIRQAIFDSQENIGKLDTVYDFVQGRTTNYISAFAKTRAQFWGGQQYGYVHAAPGSDRAARVATTLLRLQMHDLIFFMEGLQQEFNVIVQSNPTLPSYRQILTEALNLPQQLPFGKWTFQNGRVVYDGNFDVAAINQSVKNAFDAHARLRETKVPFDRWIFTTLFNAENKLLPNAKNVPLKFSARPYYDLYSALNSLIQMNSATKPIRDNTVVSMINKFFTARDAIKESLKDVRTRDRIEFITDIRTPTGNQPIGQQWLANTMIMINTVEAEGPPPVPSMQGGANNPAVWQAVLTDIRQNDAVIANNLQVSLNDARLQMGEVGNFHPQQYIDLDNLFGEICSMAGIVMNSIVSSRRYTTQDLFNSISDPVASQWIVPKITDAVASIVEKWNVETANLYATAIDVYGVAFEPIGLDPLTTFYTQMPDNPNPTYFTRSTQLAPIQATGSTRDLRFLMTLTIFDNIRFIRQNPGTVDYWFQNETYAIATSNPQVGFYRSKREFTQILPSHLQLTGGFLTTQNPRRALQSFIGRGKRRKTYRKKIWRRRRNTYRRRR